MKNSKTKKILSILLAVMMVVGMIPATAIPVYAADEATCPIEGAIGTGTEDDPVIVDTYEELKASLEYTDELYIQVDTDIECEDTLYITGYEKNGYMNVNRKYLTINGTLRYNSSETDSALIQGQNKSDLILNGKGKIISNQRCLSMVTEASVTINGDLYFESRSYNIYCEAYLSESFIYGGIFDSTENCLNVYASNLSDIYIRGGTFLDGVNKYCEPIGSLFCLYNDGEFVQNVYSFRTEIGFALYELTFSSKTEAVPSVVLGKEWVSWDSVFEVGKEDVIFNFVLNKLPKQFLDAGYQVKYSVKIRSGAQTIYEYANTDYSMTYTFDNSTICSYGIELDLRLLDANGMACVNGVGTKTVKIVNKAIDNVEISVPIPDDWSSFYPGEVQTSGANIVSTKWYEFADDGTIIEKDLDKSFVIGEKYRYEVKLAAAEDSAFVMNYTVNINGEEAIQSETDIWYTDFIAQKKFLPIVNQDTFFVVAGDSVDIEVSAYGQDVQYYWESKTPNTGLTISGENTNKATITTTDDTEGSYEYIVNFSDGYGNSMQKVITLHVSKMGFKEIKPVPTAEEFEAGVTDYGYVFPGEDGSGVPKVYFEAYELSQGFIDEGYTMETSLIDYVDGVKVGEGYEAWEYTTSLPGAHEIVQKIVIKDAEGNIVEEYTYTHKMNVMREFALLTAAYGTALYGYRVEVYQDGKLASEQTNGNDITMNVVAPVGDVKIVVSKNGYKAREYEATIPADGFFSLNAEILRWGDANLDDVLDVQDYQQTINKGLSGDHKLDGSYEQSVMDWAEDGYIDVIDCFYCILCINGTELFSAGVEYETYYALKGETINIPVIADGFGVTYEWKAPEGAPAIVEGTEDDDTVQIYIEEGKYNIGDKFTYTCIVRDMFFSVAELEVEVEIESLNNLYAVTYSYSSQYEDITGLPGKTRVKAGESITIPELIPQLDGYTFMYWYAGSDRLNPGDTYTPYQNTIIMPYMAKDYTITLHSGIGGEIFGTHKGNYGHYYYLPEMDVLPEGYVFYGWTTVEGSNEVEYKAGDRYTIKGDISFYPVIAKADDVKLTIYANDGTDTVIYTQTLAEAGASFFTIPGDLEMPTREGYVCRYFYTDPNYVHGDYHEERLFFPGDEITADADGIELYVIWIGEYSVTYDSGTDDNNVYVPYPEMYEYGDYARVSTDKPYREGYNFLYWEDANGTKYYGDEYISVTSAIVLTAVWEKADHYDIWVGGQRVSKSEPVVQCGDGTATVIDDNGNLTLVLNNATITGSEGIRTTYYSLTVEVNGENTISLYGNDVKGMDITGYFYISGTGTLNIDVMGDGAIGINGLYSIDYVTVNVEATPETSDGEAIGVTANSGSTYSMHFNNGAVINATGTYGIYNAGSMYADITSKVTVEGTKYGIYSVADFMSFGGTFVGKGNIAAIRSTNMYFYSYHPKSMVTEYSKTKGGFTLGMITWDGAEYFCDGDSGVHGYEYVTVHPAECTGEHSLDVYKGYAATCEKNGLRDSTYCTACGYVVYEREVIPALGHNYNTYAGGKAPTCTEQGIKGTYTQCDNCGDYQGEVEFIEPTWHSWGEWIFVEDHWYEEYGYGEKLYVRYCNNCNEYQETWYWYEDPNDTGSPNDWESGGAGPGKP